MEWRTVVCAFHGLFLYFEFDFFDLFAGQRSVVSDGVADRVQFVRRYQVTDQVRLIDNLIVFRFYAITAKRTGLSFDTETANRTPLNTKDSATLSIDRCE